MKYKVIKETEQELVTKLWGFTKMPKLLFSVQIAATVALFTAYLYIIIAVWW